MQFPFFAEYDGSSRAPEKKHTVSDENHPQGFGKRVNTRTGVPCAGISNRAAKENGFSRWILHAA
jgi:hypothetical protein